MLVLEIFKSLLNNSALRYMIQFLLCQTYRLCITNQYCIFSHGMCTLCHNRIASATEVELGGLFENFQESTYTRTALVEMVHQQPPTTVAKENTAAKKHRQWNSKKISGVIEIIFYWVRDRIQQNHLHIFWEEGKKNYLIMSQNTT